MNLCIFFIDISKKEPYYVVTGAFPAMDLITHGKIL